MNRFRLKVLSSAARFKGLRSLAFREIEINQFDFEMERARMTDTRKQMIKFRVVKGSENRHILTYLRRREESNSNSVPQQSLLRIINTLSL